MAEQLSIVDTLLNWTKSLIASESPKPMGDYPLPDGYDGYSNWISFNPHYVTLPRPRDSNQILKVKVRLMNGEEYQGVAKNNRYSELTGSMFNTIWVIEDDERGVDMFISVSLIDKYAVKLDTLKPDFPKSTLHPPMP